ncbi:MAG: response regulator transcription factor [Phycisphaeraceae bacterium]|nr:response regulator transcription factor [Phycisphaeraceae bacterium]
MTRILLADDHAIVRDGLKSMLEDEKDMQVIAEAEDGRQAVALTHEINPDVVIMDVAMPDLNGVEATRQIISDKLDVKVIALSMHSETRFISRMLQAGARGYLLKDCAFHELARAIRAVLDGQIYLSPQITGVVVEDYLQHLGGKAEEAPELLTARQREVLQLMAEGCSTKQIAERLHVSVKTIETHRQHIMEKVDVHSVAELTKYAIREGLTSLHN